MQYLPREGDGVLELVRGIAEPSRQRNHPPQPLIVGCPALPRLPPGANALIPTPLLGGGGSSCSVAAAGAPRSPQSEDGEGALAAAEVVVEWNYGSGGGRVAQVEGPRGGP